MNDLFTGLILGIGLASIIWFNLLYEARVTIQLRDWSLDRVNEDRDQWRRRAAHYGDPEALTYCERQFFADGGRSMDKSPTSATPPAP